MAKEKKNNTQKILKDLSKNYWAISTIVLVIVLIAILITGTNTNTCGATIGTEIAAQNIIDFANAQGANAKLINVTEKNGLYQVVLSIPDQQGITQEIPVYVTKDGKNLIPSIIPLEIKKTPTTTNQNQQQTTEIPKSDKPEVELYVWGYCPYGVQAQGPMAEVANLLGDSANFKIFPYYDGHGAYETQENKIESCIQQLEPEKYWNYAAGFVANIYPKCAQERTESCDITEATALMKSLGINSETVLACVESQGPALNAAAAQKAKAAGVTGSPTIIINGVKVNVARNADAIKTAICNAYTNAPAECSTELDSTDTAAAGNC